VETKERYQTGLTQNHDSIQARNAFRTFLQSPAYLNGTKKSQLTTAGDVIFFF